MTVSDLVADRRDNRTDFVKEVPFWSSDGRCRATLFLFAFGLRPPEPDDGREDDFCGGGGDLVSLPRQSRSALHDSACEPQTTTLHLIASSRDLCAAVGSSAVKK